MLLKVYKSRVWLMLFMLLPFVGNAQLPPDLPTGWEFTLNPTSATYAIPTDVALTGLDALSTGDWVGAFYMDDGVLECGGAYKWNEAANIAVVAFGNDTLEAPNKNGFSEGEMVYWKFYYSATSAEVEVLSTPEFTFSNGFLGQVLEFSAATPPEVCQTINFVTGWNWISFNVLPTEVKTVNTVMAGFPAVNGDIIKNQTQTMLYNSGLGAWVPNLPINPDRTYLLKRVGVAGSFDVCGQYIDFVDPITINPNGWTWLAYKPIVQLTPKNAFTLTTGAFTNQDIVKNQTQTILYNSALNNWLPTTAKLLPGSGYKLKYKNTVGGTLNYPAADNVPMDASAFSASLKPTVKGDPGWEITPGMETNMSIYVTSALLEGVPIQNGKVAAFDALTGQCRALEEFWDGGGMGQVILTVGFNSEESGNAFYYLVWDSEVDVIYEVEQTGVYVSDDFYTIDLTLIPSVTSASITGTVIDAVTLLPLDNVEVTATPATPESTKIDIESDPGWEITPGMETNMSIYVTSALLEGVPIQNGKVAAFDALTGQCRALEEFWDGGGMGQVILTVGFNSEESGNAFYYLVWDSEVDVIYEVEQTGVYVSDDFYTIDLTLIPQEGPEVLVTFTAADGTYEFTDVPDGSWTVCTGVTTPTAGYTDECAEPVTTPPSAVVNFALVPECSNVVINNFPEAPADLCFGEALAIEFGGVEVLNAASVTWSVAPVAAGTFDGTTFNLATDYVGEVSITVFGEATPPCADATMSLSFEVFALPVFDCPAYGPFCAGDENIMFAEEGEFFFDGEPIFGWNPAVAGSFDVLYVYTDIETGCSGECTFTIVVNELPVFDCPAYGPFCEGDENIMFTEEGEFFFDGEPIFGWNPAVAGSFDVLYVYTDIETGCSGECTFTIVVNEVPVAECPGDYFVCEGDDPIVFPVVPGVYTDAAGLEVLGFDPATAGTFGFTLTVTENGCTDMCTFQIEVMALPVPFAGADFAMDPAGPYALADATIEYLQEDDFSWWETSGTGTFDPDAFALNPVYIPSEADIANGSVELCLWVNSFMCGVDVVDCMTLSFGGCVNPPTAFAGDDMVACADGEAIQLEGFVENAAMFFWSTILGTGDFSDENILNPIYTPNEGDYLMGSVELCLTAVGLEGCPEAIDCMTITFNPLPEFDCPAYGPFCEGDDNIMFTEEGEFFFDGEPIFGWNPAVAGSFDVLYVYTDIETGCSGECTFTIVVNELPVFDCPAYGPFCEGDENIMFTEEGEFFFDGEPIFGWNPAVAGSFDVLYVYTDIETGCSGECTFTIVVNELPVFDCPVYGPFCEGDENIMFTEEGEFFFDGEPIFGWNPAVAGSFDVLYVYTDIETGCSASCTFQIFVNPLPYLMYEASAYTICLGETIDVTVTGPEDGAYPYTVEYTVNGFPMTDVIEDSYLEYPLTPDMAGSWSFVVLTITDANGCVSVENAAFEIEVLPLTTIITQPMNVEVVYGQPFELSVEAENATGYQWYFEGGMIAGATSDTYSVASAMPEDGGTYYVVVSGECGDVTSDDAIVTITPETQTIDFLGAVNGMSTYLELIEDDMATILAPVFGDLYYVEMKNPVMVWTPSNASFAFDEDKGAKVVLNSGWDTSVDVVGYPRLVNTVDLPVGSSYLPVYSRDVVSAASVFEPLVLDGSLFAVFSMDYSGIYWPGYGVYTLQNLVPGSAYLIVMNAAGVADFDVPAVKAASIGYANVPTNMTSWNDMVLTATQHNIAITTDALSGLQIGDVIGAFNEYGQIAGMVEVNSLRDNLVLRAFGDNPATEAVEGFVEGDMITFKVWRNGVEISVEATFAAKMPNQNVFAKDGISAVEGLKAGVTAINDLSSELTANLYPNPATDVVNINTNFVISNVKVINYVGQVIFETNPAQEDFQINTSNLVSGMYFVQIESNEGYVITKRLTIK